LKKKSLQQLKREYEIESSIRKKKQKLLFGKRRHKDFPHREFEFPKTCPKGHKDITISSSCEKLDLLDHYIQRESVGLTRFTNRVRMVEVNSGHCVVFCKTCGREYDIECYIYDYGPWKKEK